MSEHDEAEQINQLSELFDSLCQKRHEAGQEEYGMFTFIENDVIRMMVEEMVDVANYARYQVIKMLLLNARVSEEVAKHFPDHKGNIQGIGVQDFKGAKDGW